jgi:hypothetical protein
VWRTARTDERRVEATASATPLPAV